MMRAYRWIAALLALALSVTARAQFKEDAFTQNYNDSTETAGRDSTDQMFTFKEYFGGLRHKRDSRIGVSFAGSTVFIGGMQIQNRQYWKLPVIYGGIAAGIGGGIYFNSQYHKSGSVSDRNWRNAMFIGAGLIYWGSLMDGVGNFKKGEFPQAGKATLYSVLLPGLGQFYNGEYWKIPVYYTGLVVSAHLMAQNNTNYHRYKRIHNEATTEGSGYDGPVSAETALYYRNVYRRYRDYSIVALIGFYVLQIIDANVFSYMRDFDLNDNISMRVAPTVISPDIQFASTDGSSSGLRYSPVSGGGQAFGMSVGFRF